MVDSGLPLQCSQLWPGQDNLGPCREDLPPGGTQRPQGSRPVPSLPTVWLWASLHPWAQAPVHATEML